MTHRTRPKIQASKTWQFQSDSESDGSEGDRDESRDDGEEADPYEDDDRDYSL
jgi:hypothetical protein